MKHLSIDIETYSDIDLSKAGVYRYIESPNFEILLFAFCRDFGKVHVVDLAKGVTIPKHIVQALKDPNVIKHAHNAAFEILCLNHAGYATPADQWRCTMIHGYYLGYPGKLDKIGKALGLDEDKKKMAVGASLIRFFCKPCKPTNRNGNRVRNLPHHDPGKWLLFKKYNAQDVVTEMSVYQAMSRFPVPQSVQDDWVRDFTIQYRGVCIDADLVKGALAIDAEHKGLLTDEAAQLTGLTNPNSRNQLLDWLNSNTELYLTDLRKDTVAGAATEDPLAKKVLGIRKELSKSSVSKYQAMATAVCTDGRVHGMLQFYGAARTGRWSGRLVQLQNLPRNHIDNLDTARDLVKKANRKGLALLYGDISDTLSQLIRTAFVAPEGYALCMSDFSAIEARVLSWLTQEQWRLQVFETTGKIYEASASQMFGVPAEKIKKGNPEYALRQKGKIAELALGYGGGKNALITMGALDMGLQETELPDIVQRWRKTNPRIVDFWHKVENAAKSVINTAQPAGVHPGLLFERECDAAHGLDFLTIQLPSGRKLYYPGPYLMEGQYGPEINYREQHNNAWVSAKTYGGKLVENITQAVARDCLAIALRSLIDAGYRPLFHIHDEVVLEVDKKELHEDEIDRINRVMCRPIPWAPGLTLNAAGFVSTYYMKD